MVKLRTESYEIGYPARAAKFLNPSTLLVTGGGDGEGISGKTNKLTALSINLEKRKKPIKKFRELVLKEENEAPTCLDTNNGIILLGCNEGADSISEGHNHNLQKLIFYKEHLKYLTSTSLEKFVSPEVHQKLIRISLDGLIAAVASSKNPTVIHILDPVNLFEKYEIETNNEVKDLDISPDGKNLAYITNKTLEIISIVTGRSLHRRTDFDQDWNMAKVRFLDNDSVILGINLESLGVALAKISLNGKLKIVKDTIVSKKLKSIEALDFNKINEIIAIANDDHSLTLLKSYSLKEIKHIPNLHKARISSIAFSQDGKLLASASTSSTVTVIEIPPKLGAETHKIYNFFLGSFRILLLAVLARAGWWIYTNRRPNFDIDISVYFTLRQTTPGHYNGLSTATGDSPTSSFIKPTYEGLSFESSTIVNGKSREPMQSVFSPDVYSSSLTRRDLGNNDLPISTTPASSVPTLASTSIEIKMTTRTTASPLSSTSEYSTSSKRKKSKKTKKRKRAKKTLSATIETATIETATIPSSTLPSASDIPRSASLEFSESPSTSSTSTSALTSDASNVLDSVSIIETKASTEHDFVLASKSEIIQVTPKKESDFEYETFSPYSEESIRTFSTRSDKLSTQDKETQKKIQSESPSEVYSETMINASSNEEFEVASNIESVDIKSYTTENPQTSQESLSKDTTALTTHGISSTPIVISFEKTINDLDISTSKSKIKAFGEVTLREPEKTSLPVLVEPTSSVAFPGGETKSETATAENVLETGELVKSKPTSKSDTMEKYISQMTRESESINPIAFPAKTSLVTANGAEVEETSIAIQDYVKNSDIKLDANSQYSDNKTSIISDSEADSSESGSSEEEDESDSEEESHYSYFESETGNETEKATKVTLIEAQRSEKGKTDLEVLTKETKSINVETASSIVKISKNSNESSEPVLSNTKTSSQLLTAETGSSIKETFEDSEDSENTESEEDSEREEDGETEEESENEEESEAEEGGEDEEDSEIEEGEVESETESESEDENKNETGTSSKIETPNEQNETVIEEINTLIDNKIENSDSGLGSSGESDSETAYESTDDSSEELSEDSEPENENAEPGFENEVELTSFKATNKQMEIKKESSIAYQTTSVGHDEL